MWKEKLQIRKYTDKCGQGLIQWTDENLAMTAIHPAGCQEGSLKRILGSS